MGGIILLNKKQGITSMASDNFIKRLMETKKVGHSGTLDPFATGLLPIFFDDALRVVRYTDGYDKRYSVCAKFGQRTDTMDLEGEIIEEYFFDESMISVAIEKIKNAILSLTSLTSQVPPKHSAKKINGVSAYELARQGIEFELKAVSITIFDVVINSINYDGRFILADFDIHCSKGTYIRSICDYLGESTGFKAHACSLTRTSSGPFWLKDAYTEETLLKMKESGDFSFVKSYEECLSNIPEIHLNSYQNQALKVGKKISSEEFRMDENVLYRATYEGTTTAIVFQKIEDNKKIMRIDRMLRR